MTNKIEVKEAMDQYMMVWKHLFNDINTADQHEEPGVAMRWGDTAFPFANAAFLTEEISDPVQLKQRLETVVARMKSKKKGGLLNVCHDYLSGEALNAFDQILHDAGLEFLLTLDCMVGDILPVETQPIDGLEIKRVVTHDDLMTFSDVNCQAYGFELAWGREGLKDANVWINHAYSYIGYVGGKAVSTAATAEYDGVLYLALVATTPEAQRKGYGEALVRHALYEGHKATGLTRTLLHATAAGSPVYARVGYRKSASIVGYKLID